MIVYWFVTACVLIGHFGIHIGIYNRLNAFGWPRKRIKLLVKLFFANAVLLPIVIAWREQANLANWMGGAGIGVLGAWTVGYGIFCLSSWIWLGIPWLLWRPILGKESVAAPRSIRTIKVQRAFDHSLTLTSKAKIEASLPFNQLLDLSIEQIELPVPGLPQELDGYRIAHLSDIHLTGEIHLDYAKFVVEQANRHGADLLAITGDIIDHQACISWLPDIFGFAEAPDGCYFILGNHDTRVADSWETRRAMDQAGWVDLGSRIVRLNLRGITCDVIGNEYPWFERPQSLPSDAGFRLLLSHSPDQFGWARKQGVELMLAGHTHGGQGRLPLAGPILSPSFHGSRYASGDFYRAPTTLHVTRGIGGVHLLRIHCPPELSILSLRCPTPPVG